MPELPQKITVALELGSSMARAMAGVKREDGSVEIIATAEMPSSSFIRRGIVYNIDKTSECIRVLVDSLQDQIGRKITKIYAGISGQSLHGVAVSTQRTFTEPTKIDESIQLNIDEEAYTKGIPEYRIIEYIPQEYHIGTSNEVDPKGIVAKDIEGNYLNIVIKEDRCKNLEDSIAQANINTADILITPKVLAKHVLTDEEKKRGCALVDLGDQTTTIVVCKRGIIRQIVVIPLGAANITKDIAYIAGIEFSEAEEIKRTHGDASNPNDNQVSQLKSSSGKPIIIKDVNNYICARVEEIAINVKQQINSTRYGYELSEGIILTGGGAKLKNIEEAFKKHLQLNVKVRESINTNIIGGSEIKDGFHNGVASILVDAALSKHTVDCVDVVLPKEAEPATEKPVSEAEPAIQSEIPFEKEAADQPADNVHPTANHKTPEQIAEMNNERLRIAQENKQRIKQAFDAINNDSSTIDDCKRFLEDHKDAPKEYRDFANQRIKELTPKNPSSFSKFFNMFKNKLKDGLETVMEEEDKD